MEELLKQIEVAASHGLWYLALFSALTLPDICGAMATADGQATKQRYIDWVDAYVSPAYRMKLPGGAEVTSLRGEDCYFLRCSMLHQGSTIKPESRFDRFIFLPGGSHNIFIDGAVFNGVKLRILILAVPNFCADVVRGARTWLTQVNGTSEYLANFDRFIQARPKGLPPYFGGWLIT